MSTTATKRKIAEITVTSDATIEVSDAGGAAKRAKIEEIEPTKSVKIDGEEPTKSVKIDGEEPTKSVKIDGEEPTKSVKIDGEEPTKSVKVDGEEPTKLKRIPKKHYAIQFCYLGTGYKGLQA